jgi:hypothetical protein
MKLAHPLPSTPATPTSAVAFDQHLPTRYESLVRGEAVILDVSGAPPSLSPDRYKLISQFYRLPPDEHTAMRDDVEKGIVDGRFGSWKAITTAWQHADSRKETQASLLSAAAYVTFLGHVAVAKHDALDQRLTQGERANEEKYCARISDPRSDEAMLRITTLAQKLASESRPPGTMFREAWHQWRASTTQPETPNQLSSEQLRVLDEKNLAFALLSSQLSLVDFPRPSFLGNVSLMVDQWKHVVGERWRDAVLDLKSVAFLAFQPPKDILESTTPMKQLLPTVQTLETPPETATAPNSFQDLKRPLDIAERFAPAIELIKQQPFETMDHADDAPAIVRFATSALGHRPTTPQELVSAFNAHPAFVESGHKVALIRGEVVVTDLSAPKPLLSTGQRKELDATLSLPLEHLAVLKAQADVARTAGRFATWPALIKAWDAATARKDTQAAHMCALTFATYERTLSSPKPTALVNAFDHEAAVRFARLPVPARTNREHAVDLADRRIKALDSFEKDRLKGLMDAAIRVYATQDPQAAFSKAELEFKAAEPGTPKQEAAAQALEVARLARLIPHHVTAIRTGQKTFAPLGDQDEDTLRPPRRHLGKTTVKHADDAFDDDGQRYVKLRAEYATCALRAQLASTHHARADGLPSPRETFRRPDRDEVELRQRAVDAAYAVLVVEGRLDPKDRPEIDTAADD